MHCTACGRATGLRGGAEVLGEGMSLCGGVRRSSAGRCCEVGEFNAHLPQQVARTRIIIYTSALSIYVRPVHAVKSQSWGRKTPPASTQRPRRLPHSPRPRLHFRARVHTSPAYPSAAPTKTSASRSSSYPQWVIHGKVIHIVARHPVQNVLASRLRTRIYNISFARRPLPGSVRVAPEKSPRRCATVSRAAVRRVGEGEGKGGRPLAQCRTMPLVCRITVCKGGSAQGNPRPCPCVLPAAVCLRPSPRPLMTKVPSAGWGRAKAKADAPSRSNPPLSAYRPAPAA